MRIALLTDGIPPFVMGGMQNHSYWLAKYLARAGAQVDIYHPNLGCSNGDICQALGNEPGITPHLVAVPRPRRYPGHYLAESYLYSTNLSSALDRNGADFVYAQGLTAWALLRRSRACPIGVNLHGLEMFQGAANLRSQLEQFLFRKPVCDILRSADVVFSLGGKVTPLILSLGVESSNIAEIPIGVDRDWLRTDALTVARKRRFIFVGRYERRKGIQELNEVIPEFLDQSRCELHFIGPIPEKMQLHHPSVKYWGLVRDPVVLRRVLGEADILVAPSYAEGMPTVIMEAMAQGLAVVASDVGAVSELVSSSTGWLITPGDTQSLRRGLFHAAHATEAELYRMKDAARALISSRFTWDDVVTANLSAISARVARGVMVGKATGYGQ